MNILKFMTDIYRLLQGFGGTQSGWLSANFMEKMILVGMGYDVGYIICTLAGYICCDKLIHFSWTWGSKPLHDRTFTSKSNLNGTNSVVCDHQYQGYIQYTRAISNLLNSYPLVLAAVALENIWPCQPQTEAGEDPAVFVDTLCVLSCWLLT